MARRACADASGAALNPCFSVVLIHLICLICLLPTAVVGNVEKIVFVVPQETSLSIPQHINLPTPLRLSPTLPRLRAQLNTSFVGSSQGNQLGVALEGLNGGARYEVRVCWAATSPTDFSLHLHTPLEIAGSSSSLSGNGLWGKPNPTNGLVLYLQIVLRADYYTPDRQRMERPGPINIDIILDPYIMNMLPKSLMHIAMAVLIIATGSWWASFKIHAWLSSSIIMLHKKNN